MNKFWVVWNESRAYPTERYTSLCKAQTAGRELATKHPGENVHIFQSVCTYVGVVCVSGSMHKTGKSK